jgi:hypothetical protein
MRRIGHALIALTVALLGGGCATPKIEATALKSPRAVLIADFPDMKHAAIVRPLVTNWPAFYFSTEIDEFFTPGLANAKRPDYAAQADQIALNQILNPPRPVSNTTAGAMSVTGTVVGGIFQSSAEETLKRSAEFPTLARKAIAEPDMRIALLDSFRSALQAKGIAVRLGAESRDLPPRVRWPAKTQKGEDLTPGSLANSQPIDDDILIQLSPLAVYAAPGPLNAYTRRVGIGVAIFNGRTRQFLGWQAFWFRPKSDDFEYMTYDSLIADINRAAPALREALLSLVPEITQAIVGPSS